MAQHLIPSNATLKAIKSGDPRKRINDGAGLYLLLFVKGGSHAWRLDYAVAGRRKTLSLGTYPLTGLADARKLADDARKLVRSGLDPSDHRQAKRAEVEKRRELEALAEAGIALPGTFEAVAREWFAKNESTWAHSHSDKIIRRLQRDVFPWIGCRPVKEIKPADVLSLLKRVEERGALETTHRVQQNCGQVFRYAVSTGLLASDPSRDLRGALPAWKPVHYPTITDPREVGQLLRDIDDHKGTLVTRIAMQLTPLLFVRPGELRQAEWTEINLEAAEWRIPAVKMKRRIMHIVPLAKQAIALLKELEPLTGKRNWVFPGNRTNGEPMSENTVNAALRRMGYDRTMLTAHGFRGMASTMLHEQGWPSDVIERQLSHVERNEVKAAYNHAEYLPQRREMMQAWADYLDTLRSQKPAQASTARRSAPAANSARRVVAA